MTLDLSPRKENKVNPRIAVLCIRLKKKISSFNLYNLKTI